MARAKWRLHFVRDLHLLALDDAFLEQHRVRAYNMSVSMRCLDAASALAQVFHGYVLGYDTPLTNQAMEALGSSGSFKERPHKYYKVAPLRRSKTTPLPTVGCRGGLQVALSAGWCRCYVITCTFFLLSTVTTGRYYEYSSRRAFVVHLPCGTYYQTHDSRND